MAYEIRMGLPEMEALWNDLKTKHRKGTASKKEEQLYSKWGKSAPVINALLTVLTFCPLVSPIWLRSSLRIRLLRHRRSSVFPTERRCSCRRISE